MKLKQNISITLSWLCTVILFNFQGQIEKALLALQLGPGLTLGYVYKWKYNQKKYHFSKHNWMAGFKWYAKMFRYFICSLFLF